MRVNKCCYIFLLFFGILIFSCKQGKLNKQKLISYISYSKELNQSIEVNGIMTKAKVVPYQLMVLQEIEGRSRKDSIKIGDLEKKYSAQYYFSLSFSKGNKEVIRQLESFQRYSEMLQVFSFGMGKYINATDENSDTVALADYAFEQDYGMTSSNKVLLVFKKADFTKAEYINLNVEEFGLGVGNMKFVFRRRDIENIPALAGYESVE